MSTNTRALIVVDIQNDFCEGGSLGVTGGAAVARDAAAYLREHGTDYAAIVATADWHIDPGTHFSDTPDFVDSWPPHCRVGTPGADFHPDVAPELASVDAVFRKGRYSAAYSGFEGSTTEEPQAVAGTDPAAGAQTRADAVDDDRTDRSGDGSDDGIMLGDWLRDSGITEVDVIGIATDHCVRATALDAARQGFTTRVMLDLTAGVSPETTTRALAGLRAEGVELQGTPRTS